MAPHLLKRRWSLAIVFAFVAVVGLTASVASRWTHDVLLDTDAWMETVGPIGSSPAVTGALSERFSGELIEWVDAANRLESLLPPILTPLAGYGARFINSTIVEETDRFFESDFYERVWLSINETAHRGAVAIIRDEVPGVSTEGGMVTVDLIPVLEPIADTVFGRLGELGSAVPEAVLDRISIDDTIRRIVETYENEGLPEFLDGIVVFSSDRLAAIQATTRWLDRLIWVLPIITLLATVGALYFAPNRWRVGWFLLGGAALGWLLALLGANLVVDSVVSDIQTSSTALIADEVFSGVASGLETLLVSLAVVAAIAAAVVFIAAPNDSE